MNLRAIGGALVLSLITGVSAKAQIFYPTNNGFETPDLGTGWSYLDALSPTQQADFGWGFTGAAGLTGNGSFQVNGASNGNTSLVDGTPTTTATSSDGQAVLLQSASSISQSISLAAGTYEIVFDAEGRSSTQINQITVSLGGTDLLTLTPSNTSTFDTYTSAPLTLDTGGNFLLTFTGNYTNGGSNDYTTFIDNVEIQTVTPEPSTTACLFIGGIALLAYRRFRRTSAA